MRAVAIAEAIAEARLLDAEAFTALRGGPAFVVELLDRSPDVAASKGESTTRYLKKDALRAEIEDRRDLVRTDAWVFFADRAQEAVSFGRSTDSDVVLPYAHVSRRHVLVQRLEGRWLVMDDGSRNGVGLNGRPILARQWAAIGNNDALVLGDAVRVRAFLVPANLHRVLREVELVPVPGRLRSLASTEQDVSAEDDTRTIRLELEHRFFRILDDLSSYGVIIADKSGRPILFNDAGRRILGERSLGHDPARWSEELGLCLSDRAAPLPADRMPLARAIRGERPDDVELFVQNPGLPRGAWIRVTARPIRGIPRVNGGIMFFHDITESKRLEQQRRQEQKMEAIGLLAGGIAHDFNNLLTVVNGRAELMLARLRADDPLRDDVDEIRKVGERAAALTRQLLAFSRKQVLEPAVVDLNGVVHEMDRLLRRLVGEHIALETRTEPALWRVAADPGQLQQVLLNLVVNARDAMPGGGRLSLTTSNVDQGEGDPDVPAGTYAVLAVTDTGCGMNEDTLAHLFEPFFSTKPPGQGTGLGLSVVYGIVKQSGGHVVVESAVDRGTTFRVFLPRVEAPLVEAPPSSAPASTSGTGTILLVEDEDVVRSLARQVLESSGYRVIEARNGEEALRIAETGEPFDLLLTDVVMPVLGGPALHQALVASGRAPRVLFMSGYSDEDNRGGPRVTRPLLQKPFSVAALLESVRAALKGA